LSFTVLLHPRAAKSLKKLQTSIRNRILESLKKLEQRPEKGDQMKPSQFWKLLVGDYRVIYEVNQQTSQIIVLHVGHRKKVYDYS
jgi:mRNA interferase RelE/StbE